MKTVNLKIDRAMFGRGIRCFCFKPIIRIAL